MTWLNPWPRICGHRPTGATPQYVSVPSSHWLWFAYARSPSVRVFLHLHHFDRSRKWPRSPSGTLHARYRGQIAVRFAADIVFEPHLVAQTIDEPRLPIAG